MKPRSLLLPLAIFVALLTAFAFYVVQTTPALPERVATHFDAHGAVNGWMSRTTHECFMLGIGLGTPLFLLLVFMVVRACGGAGCNIPHRDYWLAPERRAETLAFMQRQSVWFACVFTLLFADIHRVILTANLRTPPVLPVRELYMLIAGFLAAVLTWIAWFGWRFRRCG